MDFYYVVDTQSEEYTCCEDIDFQKNPSLNDTNSLPSLNISVETPKIDITKYKSYSRDSSQILLDLVEAIKGYFMKKSKSQIIYLFHSQKS